MKNFKLLFIISMLTVFAAQGQHLTGFSIDVEYKTANRYTADYNIEAFGVNIYKTLFEKNKFEVSASIGYVSHHPLSAMYSNIDVDNIGDGNDKYIETYSYGLRSIPYRLIGTYKIGKQSSSSVKISLITGVAAKKITETKGLTEFQNYSNNETQIITAEKYASFVNGLQVDFRLYKKVWGFVRIESHSNSSLNYLQYGYFDDWEIRDETQDVQLNHNTSNERFTVFGFKYNL